MNKQHTSRILLVVAAVLVALWTLVPTFRTMGLSLAERVKFDAAHPDIASKAIKLGLDLQGGTHLVLEVDKTGLKPEESKDAADRSLEVVRNRIDQFGVSEPDVRKSGDSRLVVELAGVNPEQAKELLSSTAQLEFKLVREEADIKTTLDRIEAVVSRGASDTLKKNAVKDSLKPDSASLAQDTNKARRDSAAEAARTLFTASSEKHVAAADTVKKATSKDYKARAFYSYLVPLRGNTMGVEEGNMAAVDAILKRPDVQGALRAVESDLLWGRHGVDVGGGKKIRTLFVVKRRAEMKGDIVADAIPELGQGGMKGGDAEVTLKLKGRGPKEFARITGANIGRQLAIVLDGSVYSAPVIQGRITGGTASITGMQGIDEARQLAIVLRAGALPAPMRIVEERSVGASLGAENINQGILAAVVGVLAVFAFMFLFYHGVGGIANAALILNGVFTMAILAGFHSTLTLPGIAGVVLALGMAVDANVLIYERIREELRHGKAVKVAVELGYKRAFASIFDGNITNVLTAFVLYELGTGSIKGFGLTLTIGCLVSLFTAIFCTRIVFDIWLSKKERKTLSIGHSITYFENAKLNILGNARKIGLASAIVVGIILVSMVIPKGKDSRMGINWGTDFTGGVSMTVDYQGKMDPDQMVAALEKGGLKGVNVKTLSSNSGTAYSVGFKSSDLEGDKAQEATVRSQAIVKNVLGKDYPAVKILGTETVGPKIGSELRRDAFLASLLSLLAIVIYVWFRFGKNGLGYGIAGVLTLVHDSIMTMGLFIVLGLEVDMNVIAAILTLIGYSLNDTIVVFDRIREDAGKYRKEDFEVLVNNSINETLSRTVMTSAATLLAALSLWVLGGPTLRHFSLALVFGITIGTYSSIAISSPIVVWWVRRRGQAGKEAPKALPRTEARVRQA